MSGFVTGSKNTNAQAGEEWLDDSFSRPRRSFSWYSRETTLDVRGVSTGF